MNTIRKIIRITVFVLLLALLCGIIAVVIVTDPRVPVAGFDEFSAAPLTGIAEKCEICDSEGNVIFLAGRNGNPKTELAALKEDTANAFIAIEDARFYEHGAVDVKRIAGAVVSDVASMSAKEGASTITQQLVKNTYLTPEKTLTRKLKEVRIARAIEDRYTKSEILELYLNSLYFGSDTYGIESAARRFFGKHADSLTLDESATLAAIINNPRKYDPLTKKENTEKRKRLVLGRMASQGFISEDERAEAEKETALASAVVNGNLFINYVAYGKNDRKVRTAFDARIQLALESAMNGLVTNGEYTAAAIIFDVKSEEIVAAASNTFANIAGLKRQPGSTIKPLLCYAPALESGLITPITPLLDVPTDFGGYAPHNYNGEYCGWISAKDSLKKSLNIPAVKLLDMNGIERSKQTAAKLGIDFGENDNGLALALGGMEYGVDLATLGRAYCKIAAGGKHAVSKETAYFINSMLTECAASGTAKKLAGVANVAAKTGTVGTSGGDTDAYCVAYNPRYVAAVWIGTPGGKLPDGITGGSLPAEICAQIMKRPELKSGAFAKPKTIVSVDLDATELEVFHRVTPAGSFTLPKDRLSAEFSIYHMPKKKCNEDLSFGDYENFKVVEGFLD